MIDRLTCRLGEPDQYNNVEVIFIRGEQLKEVTGGVQDPEAVITVTSRLLHTKYQPVSVVITGQFEFDSVKVKDWKIYNYADKVKESADVGVIVAICVVLVLISGVVVFIT